MFVCPKRRWACQLARALGIEANSPQRRFFAARGLAAESPTPRFSRGGAPKGNFRFMILDFRLKNEKAARLPLQMSCFGFRTRNYKLRTLNSKLGTKKRLPRIETAFFVVKVFLKFRNLEQSKLR